MRVAMFFDFNTIKSDLKRLGLKDFEYDALIEYLADSNDGRYMTSTFVYLPIQKKSSTSDDLLVRELSNLGFMIIKKEYYEAVPSFDIEITRDIYEVVNNRDVDIILVYSDSENLVPIILNFKNKGYRVEVVGTKRSKLTEASSGFIDLREVILDDIETLLDEENKLEENIDEVETRTKKELDVETIDSKKNTSEDIEVNKEGN